MSDFESQFADLLVSGLKEPPLLFDLDTIVPGDIRSATADEVRRCLAAYSVAETLMPDLLADTDGWHSKDIQSRCRKVIERFLGNFRIRLHWITSDQPLGYHRHGVIDVIGVKEEGYRMDVGFGMDKQDPPEPKLKNLDVVPGSVYVMQTGMWHQLKHRGNARSSVSLNIKQLKTESESKFPSLPPEELREKLKYFGTLMSIS